VKSQGVSWLRQLPDLSPELRDKLKRISDLSAELSALRREVLAEVDGRYAVDQIVQAKSDHDHATWGSGRVKRITPPQP